MVLGFAKNVRSSGVVDQNIVKIDSGKNMDIILPKTKAMDIQPLQNEFENDLIAFYKLLEEDINKLLDDPDKPIEDIITEIQKLFS